MIKVENYATVPMDLWVRELAYIYGGQGQRSSADYWLQVVQHIGVIAEAAADGRYRNLTLGLVRATAHVFVFWGRLPQELHPVPLSEAITRKYPQMCPHCHSHICLCMFREPAYSFAYHAAPTVPDLVGTSTSVTLSPIPTNLDSFVEMFGLIYGPAHRQLSIEVSVLRLVEEVAEVANVIRLVDGDQIQPRGDLKALANEVADVLSWLFILSIQVGQRAEEMGNLRSLYDLGDGGVRPRTYKFSTLLWNTYGGSSGYISCPSCRSRPCNEVVPEPNAKL